MVTPKFNVIYGALRNTLSMAECALVNKSPKQIKLGGQPVQYSIYEIDPAELVNHLFHNTIHCVRFGYVVDVFVR